MLTELKLKSVLNDPQKARITEPEHPTFYGIKSAAAKSINFELRYTFPKGTKQQTRSLGSYPKKSLSSIRKKAAWYRECIAAGEDPALKEKEERMGLSGDRSFGAMIDEWSKNVFLKEAKDKAYIKRVQRNLEVVKAEIGSLQTASVSAKVLLAPVSKIAKASESEAARTINQLIQVFSYANRIHGTGGNTAAFDLKGTFRPARSKKRPAITDEDPFKTMIGDALAHTAKPRSDILFLVALITFARIGELVPGRWEEVDWENRIWHVPAYNPDGTNRTKKAKYQPPKAHDIYLTDQLIQLLRNLQIITGNSEYMFASIYRSKNKPHMNVATVQKRLKETKGGIYKGIQSQHGFRTNASTWIAKHHSALPNAAIAVEIASGRTPEGVEYVYNRYTFWKEQCEVWTLWSSYIESLLPCSLAEIGN